MFQRMPINVLQFKPLTSNSFFFSEAWQSVISDDPLADSDDEFLDRHARTDYGKLYLRRRTCLTLHLVRRLNVVSRICKRPPSPT